MNNGLIQFDEDEEKAETSNEQIRLTQLIEALSGLSQTTEWSILVNIHFGKEKERIERLLMSEAKKSVIDSSEILRLQGELKWAIRYSDIRAWVENLRKQLSTLKKHE